LVKIAFVSISCFLKDIAGLIVWTVLPRIQKYCEL